MSARFAIYHHQLKRYLTLSEVDRDAGSLATDAGDAMVAWDDPQTAWKAFEALDFELAAVCEVRSVRILSRRVVRGSR